MKKRIFSIILAVVMIVAMIPMGAITAFAETTSKTITANETINGGTFSGDFGSGHAVTISGSNVTEVTFNDVTFENITSTGNGGAVYVDVTGNSFKLTFNRCKFINCSANYGGAVYLKDVSSNNTVTFNGCVALDCKANNYGGFLYIEDKNTKINERLNATDNYTVVSNCSATYGGGVYAADMTLLKNFVFDGNKATKYGGGMYNNTGDGPASVTENCLFYRNSVSDEYYGGGLYVNDSDGTVRNCRFVENIAKDTQYGGDLYTDSSIEGCTVVSNYEGSAAVYDEKEAGGYTVKAPSNCQLNEVSGTEADPYKIESTDDWDALYYAVKGGNTFDEIYIKLENDIVAVNPIGQWISDNDKTKAFKGTFDGNGHTVNLYLAGGYSNNAAFNFTDGATIKNLTVKGYVKGNSGAAGIISHAENTTVENCVNYADIDGADYVAGIIGWAKNTNISNCKNYGDITATNNNAGGIIGRGYDVTVTNCQNSADVTGNTNIGGIVGRLTSGSFNTCENYGNISGNKKTGGIIGCLDGEVSLINCLSCGEIKATDKYAGGIIGREGDEAANQQSAPKALVKNCHVFGSVSANSDAYAITGNSASGSVYKCCFYDKEKCPEDSHGIELSGDAVDECVNEYIFDNISASDCFAPVYFDENGNLRFSEEFSENTPSLWERGKTAHYYLAKNITFEERITVLGEVHLYLLSGATLTAKKGITLESGNTLNVYGSKDSSKAGKIIATTENNSGDAAIGGLQGSIGNANTNYRGFDAGHCGTLKLYGGSVSASGEVGFGGCRGGDSYGDMNYFNNGGNGGNGGDLWLYGGILIAEGTEKAIGGGNGGNGIQPGSNGSDTQIKYAAANIIAKMGKNKNSISKTVAVSTVTSFDSANYIAIYPLVHEHNYEAVYEWSEDNATCTAKEVCTVCPNGFEGHIRKTANATSSGKHTDATCTEKGYMTYTAVFDVPFETQKKVIEDENATGHNWQPVDNTQHRCLNCKELGNHIDENHDGKCDVCGYVLCEHKNTEPTAYDWNTDHTACTATKRCNDCGEDIIENATVTVVSDDPGDNCITQGKKVLLATFASLGTDTVTVPGKYGPHSFSGGECTFCHTLEDTTNYFYIKNNGSVTATVTWSAPNLQYSIGDKNSFAAFTGSVTLAPGEICYFKGSNTNLANANIQCATSGASLAAGGDMGTLLNGTGNVAEYSENALADAFKGLTALTDISNLTLCRGNTVLNEYCFKGMFYGCTGLTSVPQNLLPATTLAIACYQEMFYGCTGLTSVPENLLPATTLATDCYYEMFRGCTGLTTLPEKLLPATTLATYCYYQMFRGCTNLKNAPDLPADDLCNYCYFYMFYGCPNLSRIKLGFTKWGDGSNMSTYRLLPDSLSTGVTLTIICPRELDTNIRNEHSIPWSISVRIVKDFTVTFDLQGYAQLEGVEPIGPALVGEGMTLEAPPAPSNERYVFGGWYKEPECINPWDFANDKVYENITLYAKCIPASCTVWFYVEDAEGTRIKKYQWAHYGQDLPDIEPPTREGLVFLGYYLIGEMGAQPIQYYDAYGKGVRKWDIETSTASLVAHWAPSGTGGHTHTFASAWSYNDTHHWHESTCNCDEGVVSGFGAHTFDEGVVDGNITTYTCECGYRYTVDKTGDGNGDGKVDDQDLILLRQAILTDAEYNQVLDCNGDGVVDICDLVRMKKHIADNTVPFGK